MENLNNIKQLEKLIEDLNNSLENLYSVDFIEYNDEYKNINEYVENYKVENNIIDELSICDIIYGLTDKIEIIKEVINSDMQNLYKKELQNHNKEYGIREVIEPKKEDPKVTPEPENKVEFIQLSELSEQRKIIKSSTDKILKIIESENDKKVSYLCDTFFMLNSLNENIKDDKKVNREELINNFYDITYNLRRLSEHYYTNKRRVKTLRSIHDNINDILNKNIFKIIPGTTLNIDDFKGEDDGDIPF